MPPARLLHLRKLLGRHRAELSHHYGPKVAWNVFLLEHASLAPVAYRVPDAVAIPAAATDYQLTEADLAAGLAEITRDVRRQWQRHPVASRIPLLLRSSDTVSEGSGEHESPVVLFDPWDRRGSVRRIYARAQALRERATMGLLLQRMVGASTRRSWGEYLWGEQMVSAVGETHNPHRPTEVLIAMAGGLATQVVAPTEGFPINVTAVRATGAITHVSNRSAEALRHEKMASVPVTWANAYVQKARDAVRLRDGALQTWPLDDVYVAALPRFGLWDGQLTREHDPRVFEGTPSFQLHQSSVQFVGALPIANPDVVREWVDVLRYFSTVDDPLQIEGAHVDPVTGGFYLFQALPVPLPAGWGRPLTLEDPDIVSDRVLGVVDVECPLVIAPHPSFAEWSESEALRAFDAQRQGAFYAMYCVAQDGHVLADTPHATIRLEFGKGEVGVTTHAVTDLRLRMGRRDGVPRALATGVIIDHELEEMAEHLEGKVRVFRRVRIQSNGQELRVKILSA